MDYYFSIIISIIIIIINIEYHVIGSFI